MNWKIKRTTLSLTKSRQKPLEIVQKPLEIVLSLTKSRQKKLEIVLKPIKLVLSLTKPRQKPLKRFVKPLKRSVLNPSVYIHPVYGMPIIKNGAD